MNAIRRCLSCIQFRKGTCVFVDHCLPISKGTHHFSFDNDYLVLKSFSPVLMSLIWKVLHVSVITCLCTLFYSSRTCFICSHVLQFSSSYSIIRDSYHGEEGQDVGKFQKPPFRVSSMFILGLKCIHICYPHQFVVKMSNEKHWYTYIQIFYVCKILV